MKTFRLTGNYGTFVIQRFVEAADRDAAWAQTGIATTLMGAGWTFLERPDGEEWEIVEADQTVESQPEFDPERAFVSQEDYNCGHD